MDGVRLTCHISPAVFFPIQLRTADVAKVIAQNWRTLSDAERFPWVEMGRLDRERYEREKANYKGPLRIPNPTCPGAPKKPASACLSLSNGRRAKENPQLTGSDISPLLSKLWNDCPREVNWAQQREAFKKESAKWQSQEDADILSGLVSSDSSSEGTRSNQSHNLPPHHSSICVKNHQESFRMPRPTPVVTQPPCTTTVTNTTTSERKTVATIEDEIIRDESWPFNTTTQRIEVEEFVSSQDNNVMWKNEDLEPYRVFAETPLPESELPHDLLW